MNRFSGRLGRPVVAGTSGGLHPAFRVDSSVDVSTATSGDPTGSASSGVPDAGSGDNSGVSSAVEVRHLLVSGGVARLTQFRPLNWLTILVVCSCIQMDLHGRSGSSASGEIKVAHLLVLGILLLIAGKVRPFDLLTAPVVPFFVVYLIFGALLFVATGAGLPMAMSFALLAFVTGFTAGQQEAATWRESMQTASRVVTALVLVKLVIVFPELRRANFYTGNIYTFFSGGPNIEATWMAIFAPFLGRNMGKYAFAAIVCGAYSSRTGLIALVVAYVLEALTLKGQRRIRAFATLGGLAVLGAVAFPAMVQRVGELGGELSREGTGRVFLWKMGARIISAHPFGVGPGSGIPEVQRLSGIKVGENNFHNVPLQIAVDVGLLTSLLFVVSVPIVIWIVKDGRGRAALAAFGFACLTQFTGAEVLYWVLVGVLIGAEVEGHRRSHRVDVGLSRHPGIVSAGIARVAEEPDAAVPGRAGHRWAGHVGHQWTAR